ncbi:MAG TPA: VCBS repeat-containing protein [Candidatus Eisenbacteria bacterium]
MLLGNGDGTLVSQGYFDTEGANELALADLDGDGHLDLATPIGSYLRVFKGNGNGTFQPAMRYRVGGGNSNSQTVAVGDLNADGRPDIVGTSQDADRLWVLLANNAGGYKNKVLYRVGSGGAPHLLDSVDRLFLWSAPWLLARQPGQRSLIPEC